MCVTVAFLQVSQTEEAICLVLSDKSYCSCTQPQELDNLLNKCVSRGL